MRDVIFFLYLVKRVLEKLSSIGNEKEVNLYKGKKVLDIVGDEIEFKLVKF